MELNPGNYDRLIRIEKIASQGNVLGGGGTITWELRQKAWAKVSDLRSRERFASDAGVRAASTGVFVIPFSSTVSTKDRIFYNDKYWRIIGLAEVGYRELLEISAEVVDE